MKTKIASFILMFIGYVILALVLTMHVRDLKVQVIELQIKIDDLEKRAFLREIPKLHLNSATIFINGGEITVKTME